MQFINYTLTSITSFLGLIVGIILAYIAREELKDGKKYFIILQKVILTLVPSIFLFYFFNENLLLLILSLLIFFVLNHYYIIKIKSYYIYPILAILFFFSSKNIDLFKIQAFLIFLYGFPTGSLLTKVTKRNYLEIALKHVSFVIIALLLFFIFP